ncbi:hypothetical protein [Nocardiopsis nanhaiensis]
MESVFQVCVREAGCTLLLSSHILAQVEALADHVSIIRSGRVVESGTLNEMRHLSRTSVTARTDGAPDGLDAAIGRRGAEPPLPGARLSRGRRPSP